MAVAHGSRPPGAILPASGADSQYSFALVLGKTVPPPAQASPTLIAAVTWPPVPPTYVHYSKAAPAEDPLQGQGQGRRRQPQRVPWDGGVPRGISSQPTSSHRVVWVGAVTAGVRYVLIAFIDELQLPPDPEEGDEGQAEEDRAVRE